MIRDEFKNADKKTINKKANKKMASMGERAYYAKKMATINDLFGPIKGCTIFSLICFVLCGGIYLAGHLLAPEVAIDAIGWVVISVAGLMIIWTFVWFLFLAPYLHNKADFYKSELERLSREYILKQAGRK